MIYVHKPLGWFKRNFASAASYVVEGTLVNYNHIEQVTAHSLGAEIVFSSGTRLVVTETVQEIDHEIETCKAVWLTKEKS